MTGRRQAVGLVIALAAVFAAAGIGSVFTSRSVGDWYAALEKPPWNPPSWVFGPVWTVLYAMMAVAAWLVWRQGGWKAARLALGLFAVQLALNAGWSAVFFGARMPGLAFAELVALWLAILATTAAFFRKSVAAGVLMLPYAAWTTFAGVLNFTLWRLNV
jgi:tryptophan-rich sensory protein